MSFSLGLQYVYFLTDAGRTVKKNFHEYPPRDLQIAMIVIP